MKIFLSFASEDKAIAERVNTSLTNAKHKVFFSPDSISPGADFIADIAKWVAACDLFIFLVSPHSVKPDSFTQNELGQAKHKWPNPVGHLLPIKIAPTPTADIPAYVAGVNIAEPTGDIPAWAVEHVKGFGIGVWWGKAKKAGAWAAAIILSLLAGWGVSTYFTPEPSQIAEITLECDRQPLSYPPRQQDSKAVRREANAVIVLIKPVADRLSETKDRINEIIARQASASAGRPAEMAMLDDDGLKQTHFTPIREAADDDWVIYRKQTRSSVYKLPIPTIAGYPMEVRFYMEYKSTPMPGNDNAQTAIASEPTVEAIASASIEPRQNLTVENDDTGYPADYKLSKIKFTLYDTGVTCWSSSPL